MIDYPMATPEEKRSGWTVSYKFLEQIKRAIRWEIERPSLEEIEVVLVKAKKILEGG